MTLPTHRPTRRELLQVGGIAALGLSLPRLLRAQTPVTSSRTGDMDRSCIFVVQYRGASHINRRQEGGAVQAPG
jgi:hypothetical protein